MASVKRRGRERRERRESREMTSSDEERKKGSESRNDGRRVR
jgi:hypothetical protein